MPINTAIQWCDSTVNPFMGRDGYESWLANNRSRYAGKLRRLRLKHRRFVPYFGTPRLFTGRLHQAAAWGDLSGTDRTEKPWLNGLPRIIFMSDTGDALSEYSAVGADDDPVDQSPVWSLLKREVLDVVQSERGRRHQWLWLTKRPQRLAGFVDRCCSPPAKLPPNLWIGTSVNTRASLRRGAQLAAVGGDDTIRFVSVESIGEQVSLGDFLDEIHWVIVGRVSDQGRGAKRFDCCWARRLIDECHTAGVPIFVRKLGSHLFNHGCRSHLGDASRGEDWGNWPADLRMRQMPVARIVGYRHEAHDDDVAN